MDKKAQIGSKVFIYILIIMVFSFILLFGFKAVKSIKEKGEQATLIQLRTQLRADIASLSSQYGSVEINEYDLPLNIGEVCFVDLNVNKPGKISSGLNVKSPIIADQIEGGTENNLFMFDDKGTYIDSLNAGDLQIEGPGWICYKNENGRFTLDIEGAVGTTKIRKEFSVSANLLGGIDKTLEIEEIPGLKLYVKLAQTEVNAVIKLSVGQLIDPDSISDRIIISTTDAVSGEDYQSINLGPNEKLDLYIPITQNCNDGDPPFEAGATPIPCTYGGVKIAKYDIKSLLIE